MISREAIDAFNNRITLNPNSIKDLTVAQQDQVKTQGSQAEALLKNRDLAYYIHAVKFDILDQLSGIQGHSSDDNSRRIALSNQLTGIDQFVAALQRAVYYKNRVVKLQTTPIPNPEEVL